MLNYWRILRHFKALYCRLYLPLTHCCFFSMHICRKKWPGTVGIYGDTHSRKSTWWQSPAWSCKQYNIPNNQINIQKKHEQKKPKPWVKKWKFGRLFHLPWWKHGGNLKTMVVSPCWTSETTFPASRTTTKVCESCRQSTQTSSGNQNNTCFWKKHVLLLLLF